MARAFDEVESELRKVERLIRALLLSDGFAEDAIALEKRRRALLVELQNWRRMPSETEVGLVSRPRRVPVRRG